MQTTSSPSPSDAGLETDKPSETRAKYNGKRKNILHAAHHVISERGTKQATITEIAKRAGVVDSIIYHYFKNKEDLIFSVLDLQLLNALEDLKYHFKGIMGPVSKLGKMIWYHMHMNDHGNAQMRKSMLLECRNHPNFREHHSYNTLMEYVGIMDAILERGIKEAYFSPDLNIPVARTVILGLLDEEALMCTAVDGPSDTLSDFENIINLLLPMIENRSKSNASKLNPDKHDRILHAAKGLFAQKGFEQATMAEVAALAGVAEGTIYEYFKNKEDLLLSITKAYFGSYKSKLDNAFVIEHPIEKLRRLMWHHFSIFAADNDMVTVFLIETKPKQYFYTNEAHGIFLRYHDKICEVVDEGKAAGVFRPEINTRVFRNFVIGSLSNLYFRWYYRTPMAPIDYMGEIHHFIDLLCRAVIKTDMP